MKTPFLIVSGLLALPGWFAPSEARAAEPASIRAPETPIEAHLGAVRLPDQPTGPVLVTPCPGCAPKSLTLAPGALLRWNGATIEFANLRERSRSRQPGTVTLIVRRETGQIIRVIGND